MHACTSTHHITLPDAPKLYIIILYFYVSHVPIMAYNYNYLLFFVWLLIVKTDKHLLLLLLGNYYLILLSHDWSTEK